MKTYILTAIVFISVFGGIQWVYEKIGFERTMLLAVEGIIWLLVTDAINKHYEKSRHEKTGMPN
jgi:hypothetical protein